MNKIILSLAALAALSTASLAAGNRSWDLRDSEYYNSAAASTAQDVTVTESAPLAIGNGAGLSAYERTLLISQQRDTGDR